MSINQLNRVTHSSTQQCIICFEDLIDQQIGIPEHCEHTFCFTCLVEWTKEQNSCPTDRQLYNYILKKHKFSSHKPYAKVNINNTQSEIYLEDDVISCHACEGDDEEYHPLLTCTGCRNSYHEFCLNSFDTSTWICPSCGCNHEERTESVNNSLMLGQARTRIRTFGLRDQGRTLRIVKPCRRLQQTNPQNPTRRIVNLITRNIPSSRTTIQAREKHETNHPPIRSIITPDEAARRIGASGIPILSSTRATALISQVKNMATLNRKRKQFLRLPPRIPVKQLPRIQRRTDAPFRPRSNTITQKSNPPTSASFIDKLLHSQKQLYSMENIQMEGAYIKISFEKHQKDKTFYDDFLEQTNSLLKETKRECDNLTVMQIDNEPLAKQHINKEFIDMNNETKPRPMINEPVKSEQNSSSINNTSVSLILSLRINDQFLSQKQTINEQQYQNDHQSNSGTLSANDYETSINDRSRIYDILMEEMLFREEYPNNNFPSNKIDNKDQSVKIPAACLPSLTLSLARQPYKTPHLLSNDNHSITTPINERPTLDERISSSTTILETSSINQSIPSTKTTEILQTIPSLTSKILKNDHISQWIATQISDKSSTVSNSITDEISTLHKLSELQKDIDNNIPLTIEMEDSIPISAKQLEIIERKKHRHNLQREIITIAKKALKPVFKKHFITKDNYKIIMKKVVTKATYSNKIDQKWIDKTINNYVKKYRTVQTDII